MVSSLHPHGLLSKVQTTFGTSQHICIKAILMLSLEMLKNIKASGLGLINLELMKLDIGP
jgi:hypothetical protein